MKRSVLAAAAALFAFPAFAADLKVAPAVKAPALAPVYDWYSGIYIGGELGYGLNLGDIGTAPVNLGTLSAAPQGFVGGAFVGWGTQFSSIFSGLGLNSYVGIEGNVDGADLTGTASAPGFLTASVKDGWLASVRGRLGLIYHDVMVYGTAGWGWGGSSLSAFDPATGTPLASNSQTQNGVTWGGGVEFPWFFGQGWKTRVQYLQYDFGTMQSTGPAIAPFAITNRDRVDQVTAGLSYKF